MDKNYISITEERFLQLAQCEIVMNDILAAFHNTKNTEDFGEEVECIIEAVLKTQSNKKGD